MVASFLLVVLAVDVLVNFAGAEKNLTISVILSFGEDGFNASGAVPAIDLALDHVAEVNNLLPGYRLRYDTVRDSEVSRVHASTMVYSYPVLVYS